jgi:type IV secretion system protein VirB10
MSNDEDDFYFDDDDNNDVQEDRFPSDPNDSEYDQQENNHRDSESFDEDELPSHSKDDNDGDEIENDVHEKKTFDQVKKKKQSGPLRLNKTMILTMVLLAVALVILFTVFINPLFKKETERTGVDMARKVYLPDFNTIMREPLQEQSPVPSYDDLRSDDEILAELPFSDEAQQLQQQVGIAPTRTADQSTESGSASTVSSRPITNDNPIQKPVTRIPWNTSGYSANNPIAELVNAQNPYAQFGLPSKEVYQQTASQQAATQQFSSVQPNGYSSSYNEANNQSNKQAFANADTGNAGRGQWNAPNVLFKGTIIPAVLETGINTDLPGVIIARVTRNIYSSLDGQYLLIPSGTRLYATYNSSISYAQSRVQVAWNTLIRPDGFELDLGNMMGVDQQGFSGYKAKTDEHFFEYLKAMGIVSLFTIATGEITNSVNSLQSNNSTPYIDNLIAENQNIINRLGERVLDRTLDIQPTLTVKQGTVVEIITNTTLSLPPLNPPQVSQKYLRY